MSLLLPFGPSPSLSRAAAFLILGLGLLLGLGTGPVGPPDDVQTHLRLRIEAAGTGSADAMAVGDERVRMREPVGRYYRENGFVPAWSTPNGPSPHADSLLAVLQNAARDGLRPADYHASAIEALGRQLRLQVGTGRPMDARTAADFDLLCTDAFLLYGAHLLGGRVDPVAMVPTWTLDRRQTDLVQRLRDAIDSGSIRAALDALRPSPPAYEALRRALARYRALAAQGGWSPLPDGPSLEEGVRDERVPLLRRRLQATGDHSGDAPVDSLFFDDPLRQAVIRFQERHGLGPDGVVGPVTRAAMNVPVEARIQQIAVNLERWRWLPSDLGDPHVVVNIADFQLRVVEGGQDVLQMRVAVGTPYRPTPVFSDEIAYLVFNPYWHLPHRIAVEDKLPMFQRNPDLVSKLGYDVFEGWGRDAVQVNPDTLAWDRFTAATFPYRFRQRPGPTNGLGRIKFMFPNAHDIYLHDTPSRSDFRRTNRSVSSGCIRVASPVALATYLLQNNPGWTEEHVEKILATKTDWGVLLKRKVPVHLLYWTAWMEGETTLHFRTDVYQQDDGVAAALSSPLVQPHPLDR